MKIAAESSVCVLGGRSFYRLGRLEAERDPDGSIREYIPHNRFNNHQGQPLHEFGKGPFCRLALPYLPHDSGVYALPRTNDICYIGRTVNLRKRFSDGYARISPRNCFVGGQPTNCRVNLIILDEIKAGRPVTLFFHRCEDYQDFERQLLRSLCPAWNRRDIPIRERLLGTEAQLDRACLKD